MESFLNRYRNISVLLLVICGQLILLGLQKNDQDVRVIRMWTITAVTPAARVVEWMRGGSVGFFRNYFVLREAGADNRRLREENGRLKIENNFLKNELATADRAKALEMFKERTPSRLLAANVIGIGAGSNSKVVYVNRGSTEGVMRGMAVITPDGIVGKVIAAYPTASEVLLVTDSDFAAGVMLEKQQSRGTLKGQGTPLCKVEYVAFEDKVEPGDWFYTSGDDRIFPRGFAVGVVKSVRPGQPYKEILLEPSGLQHGVEDVLIILSGTHQEIPTSSTSSQPVFISPPPPADTSEGQPAPQQTTGTEADKLRSIYKSVGESQGHFYGEGPPGSKPPNFMNLPSTPGAVAPAAGAARGGSAPAGSSTAVPASAPPSGPQPAPGRNPAATPSSPKKSVDSQIPPARDPAAIPSVPKTPAGPQPAPGRNPAVAPTGAPPKGQLVDPARRNSQGGGTPGGLPHE